MKIEILDQGALYRVWAPAKVNLFFEILGKRSDGYHEIQTVVAPISLFDRLDFYVLPLEKPDLTLECYDEAGNIDYSAPTDDSNLVARAYRVFYDELSKTGATSRKNSFLVKIFKKIPSKAGLGGGSSDAAATFAVLNEASGFPFSKERLQELAARVGSDVPLFFEDGASIGRGRGEIVEPIDLPELFLVVTKPNAGLSTPEVYRTYASTPKKPKRSLDDVLATLRSAKEARDVAQVLANRLEDPAALLWDGLAKRRMLFDSTADVLASQMTGSGTACFAIYPTLDAANRAARALRRVVAESAKEQGGEDFVGEKIYVVSTSTSNVSFKTSDES